MKKLLILLTLLVCLVIITGCSTLTATTADKRITTAKIRYFDGSMDTLEVDRWFASASGTVTLHTMEGRKVVIGANNVIIIEESEEQYNH